MPEVELSEVSRHFGSVVAVERLCLQVERGELLALLGPSGCGKTTVLRLIAGLLQPDHGRLAIRGLPMAGVPPHHRDVGIVFQNYALFPHLTVQENVAFGLEMRRVPRLEIKRRVSEALEQVRLEGFERRYPGKLSGGQQQRVALARALVIRPAVLLLDEPLAALDRNLRVEMQAELRQLQRQVGIATIFVTHDQEEALTLADRIAVMRAGRIEQVGRPAEIYERPRNRFVLEFIGRSNVLEGEVVEAAGGLEFRSGEWRLPLPERNEAPGWASLAIRPERVRMTRETCISDVSSLAAEVVNVAFLGAQAQYTLRLASGRSLLALRSVAEADAPSVGDRVTVGWSASDALLLRD